MMIRMLTKFNLHSLSFWPHLTKNCAIRVNCAPLRQCQQQDMGIMCELCSGKGWLICDFCKGQKTNVKSEKNKIYRRCPSCKASGYILCSKCKVFKCLTFPNFNDGEL